MLGSKRSIGDRLRALEAARRPVLNLTDEVIACIPDDDIEWLMELPIHPITRRLDTARLSTPELERAETVLHAAFAAAGAPVWLNA